MMDCTSCPSDRLCNEHVQSNINVHSGACLHRTTDGCCQHLNAMYHVEVCGVLCKKQSHCQSCVRKSKQCSWTPSSTVEQGLGLRKECKRVWCVQECRCECTTPLETGVSQSQLKSEIFASLHARPLQVTMPNKHVSATKSSDGTVLVAQAMLIGSAQRDRASGQGLSARSMLTGSSVIAGAIILCKACMHACGSFPCSL